MCKPQRFPYMYIVSHHSLNLSKTNYCTIMDGENTCRNKQIFCRSDKSLISPIIMLQQQMSTLPPCFHFSATQRMPFRDLFPWQIMRIRCLAIMFIRRTLRVRSLATLFPANTAPCACVHSHFILFIVFSHIAAGIS